MTQIAQPQVASVSVLRGHRTLVLAVLGALIVLTTTLILVAGNGGGSSTAIPTSSPSTVGFEAGPTSGSPSAVSDALELKQVRSGISLTTAHSGLPSSLTTNVPAKTLPDAGPSSGTPTAVHDATSGR